MPDIYQNLNIVSTKAKALEIVSILESHRWLIKLPIGTVVNNKIREDAWKIVKKD